MKSIVEKCSDDLIQPQDNVKLRLRGKGSGYKEGPDKRESRESLHLCISGKIYSKFKLASFMVEEHLKNIYHEYKEFLDAKFEKSTPLITIVKKEALSNKKSLKEDF